MRTVERSEILRSNIIVVIKNLGLPRIIKHHIGNNWKQFCDAYCHIFFNKRHKRPEEDVKANRSILSLGRERRPKQNWKCNFTGPRHFHFLKCTYVYVCVFSCSCMCTH